MSLLSSVREALSGKPGMQWQRDLAEGMAAELEEKPNASMSRELRTLMDELGVTAVEQKGDVSDDLASKRAARRSAAS